MAPQPRGLTLRERGVVLRLLEMAGDDARRFRAQVDDLAVTGGIPGDLTVWFNEPPEDGVEVVASAGVSATGGGGFILLFSNRADRLQTLEYVSDDRTPSDWPDPDQLLPLRWES
jgi:hypothetical protein